MCGVHAVLLSAAIRQGIVIRESIDFSIQQQEQLIFHHFK